MEVTGTWQNDPRSGAISACPGSPLRGGMTVIGVTGGVGCGKSEVLRCLAGGYGAVIMETDRIARDLEEPGAPCYGPLLDLLQGPEDVPGAEGSLLAPDGSLARAEMARRIFADEALLRKVNAIVHPAVRAFLEEDIRQRAAGGGTRVYVIESALLIEAGYRDMLDSLWYIYCDPQVRRERLRSSRGYSDERIDRTMAAQLSDELYRAGADVVIDNSGSLADTAFQVEAAMTVLGIMPAAAGEGTDAV